ncbi:MAG: hypothetical protein ABIY56_09090 [Dokdonella sp.]
MSYVVISSFENVDTGDLQAQGEAVTVLGNESHAREYFGKRAAALEQAVGAARAEDAEATFIRWLLLLRMPLDVADVEAALEDLEIVIEETYHPEDPFGELVIDYAGSRHSPAGVTEHLQKDALLELEAWLT